MEEKTPRKRLSWRSKKGLGFDLNEQANGSFDFVVVKGNKPLFHINVSAEFIQALALKLRTLHSAEAYDRVTAANHKLSPLPDDLFKKKEV